MRSVTATAICNLLVPYYGRRTPYATFWLPCGSAGSAATYNSRRPFSLMPVLPVLAQRALVRHAKELLITSNRYAATRYLGMRAYDAMAALIRRRFGAVRGVRAIYLCHSLAQGECYPGLSDFDLAVIFEDGDPLAFYDRMRAAWASLKRYFPISDLSILTVDEFE